jgi:hydrogenase expression/formation protein HypC
MCLAIPAQIVGISGARRAVSIALCPEAELGDWVLVHVGFAPDRIDEEQARETLDLLRRMGEAYEEELREIRASAVE